MEKIFLGPNSGQETISDETSGTWVGIVWAETGEGLSGVHQGDTTTFLGGELKERKGGEREEN
jgi:hypothetical protein